MYFLIFVGFVSLISGILFLFFPEVLRALCTKADKVLLNLDTKLYDLRQGLGISLLLVSLLIFFVVYYIIKKTP